MVQFNVSLPCFLNDKPVIDSFIFRLHYTLAFVILLALSISVGWRQHFGVAIDCVSRDATPIGFVNDYCYIHSTFSINESWKKRVGEEVPYPGVDKSSLKDQTRIYHFYYQWVAVALFVQSVLFWIPRWIWVSSESGLIKDMLEDTSKRTVKLKNIAGKIVENFDNKKSYFSIYVTSSALNLVNLIGQVFFMNWFLGGGFMTYGPDIVRFSDWDWSIHSYPSVRIFPKMAKCSYHLFGRSGDVSRHDVLCLLPLNTLHEKIYLFLWFFFAVLGALSCLELLWIVLVSAFPPIRFFSLKYNRVVSWSELSTIKRMCRIRDWFVFYLLQENLTPSDFKELVRLVAARLADNKSVTYGEETFDSVV